MNRDQITAWAREAGLEIVHFTSTPEAIERFATLVAAAEREACAQVCDDYAGSNSSPSNFSERCAAAIRARGEE